jgi:hypothetical protein
MEEADYWRDQAIHYKERARKTDDPRLRDELKDLGAVCETVADSIEEHRFGG